MPSRDGQATACHDKDTLRPVWEDKDTWRPVWDRCMKSGCVFAGVQSCQLAMCSPGCSHDHCHVLDAKRAQMFWRCVHGWQPRDLGPDPLKVLPPYATTTIPRVHCRLRWPDTSETRNQEPCAGNRAPGRPGTVCRKPRTGPTSNNSDNKLFPVKTCVLRGPTTLTDNNRCASRRAVASKLSQPRSWPRRDVL